MSNYPTQNIVVYDLEVFSGYFLAGFEFPDGQVEQFVINEVDPTGWNQGLHSFLSDVRRAGYILAGFNSLGYDDLVLTAFLRRPDPDVAYVTSVSIIQTDTPRWQFDNDINSIDLMQILPDRISLKKIGVCLGHKKLQELPISYDKHPTPEEQLVLLGYNKNDLEITRKLLKEIRPELDLRATMSDRYGIDLRSKGEATMAELALLEEYKRLGGTDTKRDLKERAWVIIDLDPRVWVNPPSWWRHAQRNLSASVQCVIELGDRIFQTPIPIIERRLPKKFLNQQIYLDDRYYSMGVGGLHSVDGPGCWIPSEDEILVDVDVASFYPNIILTQKLAPRQWGNAFLPIYQDIVDRRLKAKREGDKTTADILKVSANGTYGKSSDPYSSLYDPQLTVNVTVLGQLGLLYLIAMLEGKASVVSANTDGITVLAKRDHFSVVKAVVSEWEQQTDLEMEYTEYVAVYQKDVNNYIALKTDGKTKPKGRFINDWPDLRHTPNAIVVAVAIEKLIKNNTPLSDTIYNCQDINQFILTQAVKGNWTTSWQGQPLGKMLRFYKSNAAAAGPIIRHPGYGVVGNEGNVSNSESCIPLEDLPDQFPADLNYQWYIDEAEKLWSAISGAKAAGMNRWAEVMHRVGLRPCYVDLGKKIRSRAKVAYGEEDFTSRQPGLVMGTGTGSGLIAKVNGASTEIMQTSDRYPGKTRVKVKTDYGFELIFGARVPLTGFYSVDHAPGLDEFYTNAELKKVGRHV